MSSTNLLHSLQFSSSIQTSNRQGVVTNDGPLCFRTKLNGMNTWNLADSDVKGVPWDFDFGREAITGEEGIVGFLEHLAEEVSNKMSDTRKLHLTNFKYEDVYNEFWMDIPIIHDREAPSYCCILSTWKLTVLI